MLHLSLLSVILLSSPSDIVSADFADQLDHVDVTVSDSDAMVFAYDETGGTIGSIAVWVDDTGTTWLAADYSDGYALVSVNPISREITSEGDLSEDVIAERAELIALHFEESTADKPGKEKPKPNHTWTKCAFYAAVTVARCIPPNPFGCIAGSIKTACSCVPKLIKEYEGYKCPIIG
jgi:hypothetical protein